MRRTVTKSIAIIGEGETEWFYFDSLRVRVDILSRSRLIFQFGKGNIKNCVSYDVPEPTSH